jgi:thiol-disulfide isomerase/thioredoxin
MKNRNLFATILSVAMLGNVSAASEGQLAPACPGLSDKDLAAYRGKVVYLDFWASWCTSCKTSFPMLDQLRRELGDQGFEVVAVNLDENVADAEAFLKKRPVNFDVLYAPDASCPTEYGVTAMPSSYLIDRKGVVRHVHVGFRSSDIIAIRQAVETLLAEE